MSLKPADKLKIASAGALVAILALGALIVWQQMPASSEPAATAPPVPAAAAPIPASDFPQFLRAVESDDIQQAAAMLAKDPTLAKQTRPRDGDTALHLAPSISMAKLLLDNGADISARKTPATRTPLISAANRLMDRRPQTRDLVQFLLSRGAAEPDIFVAAAVGDIDQMKKFLAADPSLLNKPAHGAAMFDSCTPLQIAAYADQFAAAQLLMDQGADVRNRSGWHKTEALEKAAWVGGADIVALLLDHGATVNGPGSNYNDSPLHNAATMGHADVVKILLAHGAAISPKLILEVRTAMQHPDTNDGPTPGTQDEFKQTLEMLSAAPATRP